MEINYKNIKVIGFDADDTLWVNETYFRDAELEFIGALLFCAIGDVVTEFNATQEAFIEGSGSIQAESLDVILDLESLVITILAPVAGIDELQIAGIVQVDTEHIIVVLTAGIQDHVNGGGAATCQASVGFQDVEVTGGGRYRKVGSDCPVIIEREFVIPAHRKQFVGNRVAVSAQYRLHTGPCAIGDGAVAVAVVAVVGAVGLCLVGRFPYGL